MHKSRGQETRPTFGIDPWGLVCLVCHKTPHVFELSLNTVIVKHSGRQIALVPATIVICQVPFDPD